jgi:predicted transcriptional regulator
MLNPLSEPIVNHVLPALRSVVADDLQGRGYSQTEIAEMMGITQPAVSQYINQVRGKSVEMIEKDPELREKASQIATQIAHGDRESVREQYLDFCQTMTRRDSFRDLTDHQQHFFDDLKD